MSAPAPKNVSSVFNTVRRNRSHELAVTGALLLAGYLGVASVLIDTYQRPDASVIVAGG